MRIRIRDLFDPGLEMEKFGFGILVKHPGSATLLYKRQLFHHDEITGLVVGLAGQIQGQNGGSGNNNNFLFFRSELGDSFSLCPRQENDTDAKIMRENPPSLSSILLVYHIMKKLCAVM
jgi:hypothetical protein